MDLKVLGLMLASLMLLVSAALCDPKTDQDDWPKPPLNMRINSDELGDYDDLELIDYDEIDIIEGEE